MKLDEVKKDFKRLKISSNYHRVWEPFMRKYNCDFVCELGIAKGNNFEEMIKHQPKLAIAVDAWEDSGIHPRKYDDYTQEELDSQYEFFRNRIRNQKFAQIVREDTKIAAKFFKDNFFDFVYIDADHTFESCYADILAWYPKVKPGKFLVGHDYKIGHYGRSEVREAVNKFISENNLELILLPPSTWAVVKE